MTVYTFEKWREGKIKKHDDNYVRAAGSILFIKTGNSNSHNDIASVHDPDDWAETEEEARDMVLARKEQKIQSLKKQIAKLEALTEWEVQ